MSGQPVEEELTPELVIRRAMYDRMPASAFSIVNGRDRVQVGPISMDFQDLLDGIVSDLAAASVGLDG